MSIIKDEDLEVRPVEYKYTIIPWKLNQRYLMDVFKIDCFKLTKLDEFKNIEEVQIRSLPQQKEQ